MTPIDTNAQPQQKRILNPSHICLGATGGALGCLIAAIIGYIVYPAEYVWILIANVVVLSGVGFASYRIHRRSMT